MFFICQMEIAIIIHLFDECLLMARFMTLTMFAGYKPIDNRNMTIDTAI
jgi:hypothetical protein